MNETREYQTNLVSVIVPTVRPDDNLIKALHSVANDGYEHLEIILVLDGVKLPADVRTALPVHVRIVALPSNIGTPRALNAGIQAATGEFIARLDADDISVPGRFGLQVSYLRRNPHVEGIGGSVDLIGEADQSLGSMPRLPIGDLRSVLLRRNPLTHSAMMFRARTLMHVGGYNPDCRRMQDYELYLRLGQLGEIHALSELVACYRVHPGQHSRNSPPLSRSTIAVLQARHRLSATLGVNKLVTISRSATWLVWQALRHYRIVKPRFERSVTTDTASP